MLAPPRAMAVRGRSPMVTTSSWPCGVRHFDEASCRRRCAMEYRREKFSRTMGKAGLLSGRPNNAEGAEPEGEVRPGRIDNPGARADFASPWRRRDTISYGAATRA